MEDSKRRRTRSEVIGDVLSEALGGANKTRLMYRCNLNFARSNRYLGELLDAGLIESVSATSDGVAIYKTTEKGRKLLRVLRKAEEFFS
jgi:predicted transcriptional regulator